MDVRQIEYFVLAAKAGSFSAAAKSAFVTQQTLSASVASLEGEVKTPLFHRRRQGIELTDFGARFLPKCERVLEAVREAEGFALQWHESTRHTATFAYATASLRESGPGFTLATLRGFRASYDDADLRLFELTSDACLKALERGTVDMALVAGRPDSAVFEFTPLMEGRLLVAVPERHKLATQEAISFSDLAEIDLFPTPDLDVTYRHIVEGFARYGLTPRYAPPSPLVWKQLRNSCDRVRVSISRQRTMPKDLMRELPIGPLRVKMISRSLLGWPLSSAFRKSPLWPLLKKPLFKPFPRKQSQFSA